MQASGVILISLCREAVSAVLNMQSLKRGSFAVFSLQKIADRDSLGHLAKYLSLNYLWIQRNQNVNASFEHWEGLLYLEGTNLSVCARVPPNCPVPAARGMVLLLFPCLARAVTGFLGCPAKLHLEFLTKRWSTTLKWLCSVSRMLA